MDNKEKVKYIYNNVKNNKIEHDIIKTYILNYNINYSKNSNGIFVNLSILDEKYINDIYFIIYNHVNNKIYNDREKLITQLNNNDNKIKDNKNIKKIKKKNELKNKNYKKSFLKIKNLSEIQLEIIKLSKTI